MNIQEIEKEITSEFEIFDSWMDKYEYLIELGKDLPLISDAYKKEENLIKGCHAIKSSCKCV